MKPPNLVPGDLVKLDVRDTVSEFLTQKPRLITSTQYCGQFSGGESALYVTNVTVEFNKELVTFHYIITQNGHLGWMRQLGYCLSIIS